MFTIIMVIVKKLLTFLLSQSILFLVKFFNDLNKFNKLKTQKEKTKKKKANVYDTASDLCNDFLGIYFDQCNELPDAKRNKMQPKYDHDNLFLEIYSYDEWFENEESTDKRRESDREEFDMAPLEGDEEEVKEGKGLKLLTPNKLLTRLTILLAQKKAGNSSVKLKNEVRQILYLLYQHNEITKKICIILMKSL